MLPVYIYDLTKKDSQSRVRGVGRYMQLLRICFNDVYRFVDDLAEIPFDSIFIQPFFTLLQPPGLPLRRARVQVAIIHDLIPQKYPAHFPVGIRGQIHTLINKLDLHNYQYIIANSTATKKDIVRILHKKASDVYPIYPAVFSLHRTNAKNIVSERVKELTLTPYIVYVGDVTWNKNIALLAKIVSTLPVRIIWVGKTFTTNPDPENPWQAEFLAWKQETFKNPRSVIAGYVSDAELEHLYKHALCNVLISRDEGFGFSYAEAALQKTPSVLSDIGTFKETADSTALFTPPSDGVMIASQIMKFVQNEDYRRRMGQAAHRRTESFSREQFEREFETVIDHIQQHVT
jgi:glycosyltransferase involved in cell wall biosynthesis